MRRIEKVLDENYRISDNVIDIERLIEDVISFCDQEQIDFDDIVDRAKRRKPDFVGS